MWTSLRVLFGGIALPVLLLLLDVAQGFQDDERLIGWKGETYHSKVCWGGVTQCYGVEPSSAKRVNKYPKPVSSQYVYQYRSDKSTPNRSAYTHMAMIEALPNGTLLTVWQAGVKNEGENDQHFMISRSLDPEGSSWSEPHRLNMVGGNGTAVWGPVLFADVASGKLWLFYSESRGNCHSNFMDWPPGGDIKGVTMDMKSGLWGAPKLLSSQDDDEGIPKVTANKPCETASGVWLLPFWRERALLNKDSEACKEFKGEGSAGVLRSIDRGMSWEAVGYIQHSATWLIENAIVETAKGSILMVFRTQVGKIFASRSEDTGITWGKAAALADLPNPNSKIDLIQLTPGKELALVFNDHAKARSRAKDENTKEINEKGCKKCRTKLSVALSTDNGLTWPRVGMVEGEVDSTLRIHYPTILQRGCKLLVAYSRFHKIPVSPSSSEYSNQGIKVARMSLCRQQGE
ncbi:hypothetical protein CYMTET_54697 [Cymbomonas tetramitiformis]|uniref:Sialidase domain-containing protein n=1 Tax=Cymbomonas tetramitiformis TaxID=36881 RepID=A0AAE0BEQ4_9CHLO|nr:hypothetical protein CYMTET_54697 [Cymbomonas tetramitiformis]